MHDSALLIRLFLLLYILQIHLSSVIYVVSALAYVSLSAAVWYLLHQADSTFHEGRDVLIVAKSSFFSR